MDLVTGSLDLDLDFEFNAGQYEMILGILCVSLSTIVIYLGIERTKIAL